MEDCIFCKIVAKEISAHVIYENDDVVVFLDINPVKKGHALAVPKVHTKDLFEADPETFSKIMEALQKTASAIKSVVSTEGFNVITNVGEASGQTVFHTHFHIIPRHKDDGLVTWPHEGATEEELKALASKIHSVI